MIRTIDEYGILNMLKLFKEQFKPEDGYRYQVTCWHVGCPALPESIQQELKEINKRAVNVRAD